MRLRPRTSHRSSSRAPMHLAGMIDVTFLLLIYFLYAMVIAADEDRLTPMIQTKTAEESSGEGFEQQKVIVSLLDGVPTYQLGRQAFREAGALEAALTRLPRELGVVIEVDGGVPVGFAVAAVQAARNAAFEQVTYVPAE